MQNVQLNRAPSQCLEMVLDTNIRIGPMEALVRVFSIPLPNKVYYVQASILRLNNLKEAQYAYSHCPQAIIQNST